jgi:hypothetical protein
MESTLLSKKDAARVKPSARYFEVMFSEVFIFSHSFDIMADTSSRDRALLLILRGIFLVLFSSLMLQVTITRIFSVTCGITTYLLPALSHCSDGVGRYISALPRSANGREINKYCRVELACLCVLYTGMLVDCCEVVIADFLFRRLLHSFYVSIFS